QNGWFGDEVHSYQKYDILLDFWHVQQFRLQCHAGSSTGHFEEKFRKCYT
ncbi:hypothetical protein GCK32_022496, partial [Trichostrongylus colubriformis]